MAVYKACMDTDSEYFSLKSFGITRRPKLSNTRQTREEINIFFLIIDSELTEKLFIFSLDSIPIKVFVALNSGYQLTEFQNIGFYKKYASGILETHILFPDFITF